MLNIYILALELFLVAEMILKIIEGRWKWHGSKNYKRLPISIL